MKPFIFASLIFFMAGTVSAHDLWLEPSAFLPPSGATLTVRLQVGVRFVGEPIPRHEPWIRRFVWNGTGGEKRILGMEGGDPAGIVHVDPGATGWIVYESTGSLATLAGEKFQDYLREEGLDAIQALRVSKGEAAKGVTERFFRCAKAAIVCGSAAAGPFDWTKPLGLALELIPETNPTLIGANTEFTVRLLYQGRPLEGALVMALNQTAPEEPLKARSDVNGRVAFHLPRNGRWLIKAVHVLALPQGGDAEYESYWASMTFESP